jgi:hypothetical protein
MNFEDYLSKIEFRFIQPNMSIPRFYTKLSEFLDGFLICL